MSYNAYVTRIKNLRKHPNADRLQIGECFGNTVVVSLYYTDNQLGIYFPTDGQLSQTFAEKNNLLRKKDDAGNSIGGYMDPDKRNVTAVRLRGEKSDGLFLPLSCVDYISHDTLKEGDIVSTLGGVVICEKYIPKNTKRQNQTAGNRTRKKKASIAPLFVEHADTEQLAYNLSAFKSGDFVEITLKMHGTSQRTGHVPVLAGYCAPNIAHSIRDRKGVFRFIKPTQRMIDWADRESKPFYKWGYISGTRRTVLESYDGGYYGSNSFREKHSKFFEGKLRKGEEVYYEVVGFTDDGGSIMGQCSNKKLNDKEFLKTYGETTTFSYGCVPDTRVDVTANENEYGELPLLPNSDIYVYRMTSTNEDGDLIEYSPEFMRYRCEQMGVKTVPVLWRGIIPSYEVLPKDKTGEESNWTPGDWIRNVAERYYDGADPIGKTHVREGVVCRILNRPKFAAYKHKNFAFKCLEGIVKATAEAPDMEEAQDE